VSAMRPICAVSGNCGERQRIARLGRRPSPIRLPAGLRPRSFAHEPDDLLGDGAGGFFGHIVPTASKHTTLHIRRDQAHRVEQRCSNSALRAESEYRHGELALGARPTVRDSFGPEIVSLVGKRRPRRAGGGVDAHIFIEIRWCDRPGTSGFGPEQPSQELPLASLQQDLRQVIEPVEGQVPGPHIRLRRGNAGRRGPHASLLVASPTDLSSVGLRGLTAGHVKGECLGSLDLGSPPERSSTS